MKESESIKIVRLDTLSNSPVPIHIHSTKRAEDISLDLDDDAVKHPIHVAELDEHRYIIDGHLLVEAYRKSGRDTIAAKIHKVKNEQEIVALHIKNNMSNPPNPVQLVRAIVYMREHGDSDEHILESLKINKFVPVILRFEINAEALQELEGIIRSISERYYNVHHTFPNNLIEWVFKQPRENQHLASTSLRHIIEETIDVPERRFVWPTPMEARLRMMHATSKKTQAMPVSAVSLMSNSGMRGRPSGVVGAVVKKPPSKSELGMIGGDNTPTSRRRFAFKCPHGSLMYVDGKSRAYHVENAEDIVKLQYIDTEGGVYRISDECRDFMGVKNDKVFIKMCTPAQVKKYVAKLQAKKINVCILSSEEL